MNESTKEILTEIVKEENTKVPEYAFTVYDYQKILMEQGYDHVSESTIRRRLKKRVREGELEEIYVTPHLKYFVPAKLSKNAKLDEKTILEA